MIDVTFLLLIYFMVTVVMSEQEDRLSPLLQTRQDSTAGASSDFQVQIVEVLALDGEPRYRLGTQVYVDRPSLTEALSNLEREPGVFIQVTDVVPVGFAIAAVQAARDAGFEKVTYVPDA